MSCSQLSWNYGSLIKNWLYLWPLKHVPGKLVSVVIMFSTLINSPDNVSPYFQKAFSLICWYSSKLFMAQNVKNLNCCRRYTFLFNWDGNARISPPSSIKIINFNTRAVSPLFCHKFVENSLQENMLGILNWKFTLFHYNLDFKEVSLRIINQNSFCEFSPRCDLGL